MNTTKTSRATETTVTIMGQQLTAIMFPDGSYGLTVSQAATILGLDAPKNKLSTRLKELHGKGFIAPKAYVESASHAQGVVTLSWFAEALMVSAFKGNSKAQALMLACAETTLAMYCDLAFGVERTTRERVTWNEVRAAGIEVRKSMTDGIRDHYLARGEHAEAHVYIRITEAIHQAGLGFTAKEYKQAHNLPTRTNMRPLLDKKQLHRLTFAEDLFLARLARTGDITIALRQTQNTLA